MQNIKWMKQPSLMGMIVTLTLALCFASANALALQQRSLVDSIKQIKPSVVGIAIYAPIQSRSPQLLGTGFVVGNGKYVVTNYHVVSKELDPSIVQNYVALSGSGPSPKVHKMEVLAIDPVHDLAILSISDTLPALKLARDELVDEGLSVFLPVSR